MKWQYMQAVWRGNKDDGKFVDWLDLLGEEQWEFVAFTLTQRDGSNVIHKAYCLFKRKKFDLLKP